jgi:RNA-directed DNA polymerase
MAMALADRNFAPFRGVARREPLTGNMGEDVEPYKPVHETTADSAELARSKSGVGLSTLHHVLDLGWMKEAYRLTRKDGAPGTDGVTAAEHAQNLEANLMDLLERIKSGRYQAPPVRRVYIPKTDGSGSLRPLGLPTFEDKVGQRAIVMVLEAIYEQDFLPCSYGFRPGSAHQALQALRNGFMSHGLRWVIDLDIKNYFGSIPHSHLRSFLDRRVTDGVIRRMIDKWLKAGVLKDGLLRHATEGPAGRGDLALPIERYASPVLDWAACRARRY